MEAGEEVRPFLADVAADVGGVKHDVMDKKGFLRSFIHKIIFCEQYLIRPFQPVMGLQKPLHVAEFTFRQVGCVRDARHGKILKGKQPRQTAFQAVAGTAQLLVRVVASP